LKFYDTSVIGIASETDICLMSLHVADTQQHNREDSVCEISAAELERARRDPRVIELLHDADEYLAELERQGRSL
jgi:hypothetical protein